MARSLNDIQQEILDEKENSPELSTLEVLTDNEKATIENLDSTSKVSIWRMIVYIIAVGIWTLEKLFDVFKEQIIAIVEANTPHNRKWYKAKALAFQYGYPLVNDDEYEEIDEEAQVIKQTAVVEEDSAVIVKIATLDGEDLVKIEDDDVVAAFTAYMHQVKDAGTNLSIVNKDADKLKLTLDVYYDPILMRSDGSLTADPGTFPVFNPDYSKNADGNWDALQSYLRSIDFDGSYVINKGIDYIQSAKGVVDVDISYSAFKAGLLTDFQEFQVKYAPLSGYMKLEDIEVNYIASV